MSIDIALGIEYAEAEASARGWVPVLALEPSMGLTLNTVDRSLNWATARWLARDVTVEYTGGRAGPPHFVLHLTIGRTAPDDLQVDALYAGSRDTWLEQEGRLAERETDVLRQVSAHLFVDHWTHLYDGLGFRVAIRPEPGMGGLQVGDLLRRPLCRLGKP